MARRKRASSVHTTYRHARKRLADLAALQESLARSRPRTRGKKAAKTRALNKVARKIRAARGQLTKARSAIAKAARERNEAKRATGEGPSAPSPSLRAEASAPVTAARRTIPHLTPDGVQHVWPSSRSDRAKEGSYWNEIDSLLSNRPASFARFEGDSIYDEISRQRLPFITDIDTILAYSDYYHFGEGFYRERRGGKPFAP